MNSSEVYSDIDPNIHVVHRVVLITYLILGFSGNIFNIFLFTRPKLIRISSSIYLLSASIGNLLVVILVIPIRLSADGFQYDPTDFSTFTCRFLSYIHHVVLALPAWFHVLACADRWAVSSRSAKLRNFANVSLAKRLVVSTIVLCSIVYLYVISTFVREAKPPPPLCSVEKKLAVFILTIYLIIFTILPPAMMILFSLLIIRNVVRKENRNSSVRRVVPNRDRSFFGLSPMQLMLICQALVECICTLPFIIINFVSIIVVNNQHFINVYSLVRLLMFFNYVSSFYVYTLTSKFYRTQLKQLFLLSNSRPNNQIN